VAARRRSRTCQPSPPARRAIRRKGLRTRHRLAVWPPRRRGMLRWCGMAAGRRCLLPRRTGQLQEGSPLAALGPARYRRVGGTHGPSDDMSRTPLAPGCPSGRKRQYFNTGMVRFHEWRLSSSLSWPGDRVLGHFPNYSSDRRRPCKPVAAMRLCKRGVSKRLGLPGPAACCFVSCLEFRTCIEWALQDLNL